MATIDLAEAGLILETLQRLHDELDVLSDAGDKLKHSHSPEIEGFRQRLERVKAEIKAAAKHATLDGRRRPQSELERCFYGPAVQHASAHFSLRTNAPPSKWLSGLYDPKDDISYYMFGLRKLVGEVETSSS